MTSKNDSLYNELDNDNGINSSKEILHIESNKNKQNLVSSTMDSKGRSSRRKPKKTHRFVDSDEEEMDNTDMVNLDKYLTSCMSNSMLEDLGLDRGETNSTPTPTPPVTARTNGAEDLVKKEENGDDPDLPEGTVVVQPEAVEENFPTFHGPEFGSHDGGSSKDGLSELGCTACGQNLEMNKLDSIRRHPVLGVLICKKCCQTYEKKEIKTGEDGLDDCCRWCAREGELICCDFCHNAFCKICVGRNFGFPHLSAILNAGDEEKWRCYVCNKQPMAPLVETCKKTFIAVEERERMEASCSSTPRRSQLLPSKLSPTHSAHESAAKIASSIAAQVIASGSRASNSASSAGTRRGRQVNRGKNVDLTSSDMPGVKIGTQGNVVYIRTPTGGVIGIPAKNADLAQNLGQRERRAPSTPRSDRMAATAASSLANMAAQQNADLFAMMSINLSDTSANINEFNVWAVLEKLLAATQSMGMLLGSLKEDLRRSGLNAILQDQTKKRREVATKLWRAFVAYKKSFVDIDTYTKNESGPQPAHGGPQGSNAKQNMQAASIGPSFAAAAVGTPKQMPVNRSDPLKTSSEKKHRRVTDKVYNTTLNNNLSSGTPEKLSTDNKPSDNKLSPRSERAQKRNSIAEERNSGVDLTLPERKRRRTEDVKPVVSKELQTVEDLSTASQKDRFEVSKTFVKQEVEEKTNEENVNKDKMSSSVSRDHDAVMTSRNTQREEAMDRSDVIDHKDASCQKADREIDTNDREIDTDDRKCDSDNVEDDSDDRKDDSDDRKDDSDDRKDISDDPKDNTEDRREDVDDQKDDDRKDDDRKDDDLSRDADNPRNDDDPKDNASDRSDDNVDRKDNTDDSQDSSSGCFRKLRFEPMLDV